MNRTLAIIIDRATRPLFVWCPTCYFWAYRKYKQSTDRLLYALIRERVKSGSMVFDVGAHIGSSSVELAAIVGRDGRVLAFEPSPENVARLRINLSRFPNVEVYPCAVGDRTGIVTMYVSSNLNVDHRMYESPNEQRVGLQVSQVSLDEFTVQHTSGRISLVKIDVQGYEYQVLSGMKRVLETERPFVVMELWPWGLQRAGASAELVIQFFKSFYYRVSLVDEVNDLVRPLQRSELSTGEDDYYNIVCDPS